MGALTVSTPKPLLKAGGRYLIEYSIHTLLKNQIRDIVLNVSYHAEQIKKLLGDGSRYDAKFLFFRRKRTLETGGGIFQALPC